MYLLFVVYKIYIDTTPRSNIYNIYHIYEYAHICIHTYDLFSIFL